MQEKRCSFSAVVLDGGIYAIGGHRDSDNIETVERYCPLANTWRYAGRDVHCSLNFKRDIPGNSNTLHQRSPTVLATWTRSMSDSSFQGSIAIKMWRRKTTKAHGITVMKTVVFPKLSNKAALIVSHRRM